MPSRPERPLLVRMAPLWLRERLAHRFYLHRAGEFEPLFENAELVFAPGVRLDLLPTDVGHAIIALTGLYETRVSRRIAALARVGGNFIDIGANYGYYSCLWAAGNERNIALSVEASPRNLAPLIANIRKNGLSQRVLVREVAAGKVDGPVGFAEGPEQQSGWGGFVPNDSSRAVKVPCARVDTMLESLGWGGAEVMKVDVEGADTWVLEGAEQVLRAKRIRHIFFEENRVRMKALGVPVGSAQSFLLRMGYRLERLTRGEWYATVAESAS